MKENKPLFYDKQTELFENPDEQTKPNIEKMAKTLKSYLKKKNKIVDETNKLIEEIESLFPTCNKDQTL